MPVVYEKLEGVLVIDSKESSCFPDNGKTLSQLIGAYLSKTTSRLCPEIIMIL